MSEFTEVPQDPDIVFSPEYWGESTPVISQLPFRWVSKPETRQAELLMHQVGFKAVDGALGGWRVGSGEVIDASDNHLAATSSHNYPGSLLMYDVETLRPLKPADIDFFNALGEEETAARRGKFTFLPNELIRSSAVEFRSDLVLYRAGITSYTDDHKVYRRTANLAYIAKARKGARQVLEMFAMIRPTSSMSQLYSSKVTLTNTSMLHRGVIGETQVAYSPDGEFEMAYRIKSLELLAQGEPATAPSKKSLLSLLPGLSS